MPGERSVIGPLHHVAPGIHARRRRGLMERLNRPVLVFGMGSALGAGSKSHGALRYLTGWDGHESASLLILTPARARLLVASPFMAPLAQEQFPEIAPLYRPVDTWAEAVTAGAQSAAGLIGWDELPFGIAQALRPVLSPDAEAAAILNHMRLVKEPAALGLHRAGAAICDMMFTRLPSLLPVGASLPEVQRQLETFALSQGADSCRTWLTVRAAADRPRYWPAEVQGRVADGDQVLLGIALTVDGHWAHGIRMGSVGPMRPDHARLLDVVAVCLHAGLEQVRPGMALSDLAAAMEDAFAAATKGLNLTGCQRFRFGHGLGMSYEDPILTDAFVQSFGVDRPAAPDKGAGGLLAPGMVLELHPNLFLPGIGGAALGEMVIVTDTGAERPIKSRLTPFQTA